MITPDIPELARRAGATGTVEVKVQLDQTGAVVSASVYASSYNAALDEAALAAAQHSKYSAELENCKPVPGSYLFIVTFGMGVDRPYGNFRDWCSSIERLRGDRLTAGAAQLEYMPTVPEIAESQKPTTGLEERFAVAEMLANNLMLVDTVIPYNGCRAIVSASPILKQLPAVQEEIRRAMRMPDADTAFEAAIQMQYGLVLSKLPANRDAVAILGRNPHVTLIYRDRFSPLFGYDEIGVARFENESARSYIPYSRKSGQLVLGVGSQLCIEGDVRCAPVDPILP